MRVKLNPHGVAIYMNRGEARILKNILVWSIGRLTLTISPVSYRFLKKLNPMLTEHNTLLENTPTPPEYING